MPNALAKKLQVKSGYRMLLLYAPSGYIKQLEPLPDDAKLLQRATGREFDWVQAFAKDAAELKKVAPKAMRAIKNDGIFWISFLSVLAWKDNAM